MTADFRHHDLLRRFVKIARFPSFSEAGEALNMTKGAISYQIKTLEGHLGLDLFVRDTRGVSLTQAGQNLMQACQAPYENIEAEIVALKGGASMTLTVGVSTYFAARWLSPRLMSFLQDHPEIQLRLQPMIRLFDLEDQGVDIAIRWGSGKWDDAEITRIMSLPAFPVGNAATYDLVRRVGLEKTIQFCTLLRDHDDSNAWTDWLDVAGLPVHTRPNALIVPDPNVRVQAVIDGQGIALMDELISEEIKKGRLVRLSDFDLANYGYFLALPARSACPKAAQIFVEWMSHQAESRQ